MSVNKKFVILLVDDSETMRKLIRKLLRQLDFTRIVEAEDGVTAWEALQKNHIDFIVSDWNMPRMTGIEFLRKVRSSDKYADMPFLMVTGEAQKTNVIEAIEAGVSQYIVKPFNSYTLQAKLNTMLAARAKAIQAFESAALADKDTTLADDAPQNEDVSEADDAKNTVDAVNMPA